MSSYSSKFKFDIKSTYHWVVKSELETGLKKHMPENLLKVPHTEFRNYFIYFSIKLFTEIPFVILFCH